MMQFATLFTLADLDSDGAIDAGEHARALSEWAAHADGNGDGTLTITEYLERFAVNATVRAAMKAD